MPDEPRPDRSPRAAPPGRSAGGPIRPDRPKPASASRDALLDRCLTALRGNGFSHLSLREIAAEAGTSHRMLLYHFGSREGLLAEIVARIEADQRAFWSALTARADPAVADYTETDLMEVGREFWRRIANPELAPAERLFFEVYAHALYGRPWTASFRAQVIAAWVEPLTELFIRYGVPRTQAVARARLSLAVTRGLLLDLLITGERDAIEEAAELFGRLFTASDPGI